MNPEASIPNGSSSNEHAVSSVQSNGYLIVHVTTARGAIPLEGAQVTVRDYDPEFTQPRGDILRSAVTDRSGNTLRLSLPSPPRTDSLTPEKAAPFASYCLEVLLEGYRTQSYLALPIFEDITAIQPVDLIPLSENGTQDAYRPSEDRFFENTVPNL